MVELSRASPRQNSEAANQRGVGYCWEPINGGRLCADGVPNCPSLSGVEMVIIFHGFSGILPELHGAFAPHGASIVSKNKNNQPTTMELVIAQCAHHITAF